MWSIKIETKKFNKNVITLISGTIVAQALPIAVSPILTRIYSPDDFGMLSVFMSISSIFGFVVNGRYEMAIMNPTDDKEAIHIVATSLVVNIIISLSLFVLVLIFHHNISIFLNNKEIESWLFFIPVSIFLIGAYNALRFFNIRKEQYGLIKKSSINKSVSLVFFQLLLGFTKFHAIGLITGYLASLLFSNKILFKTVFINGLKQSYKIKNIKFILLKYIDFPKYSLPSSLANSASQYLVNIFIPIIFNITILGYYSLLQRVLSAPMSLISTSYGQVYLQNASIEKSNYGNARKTFMYTFIRLMIIAIPIYVFLYLFSEEIFTIVFGEEWSIAGKYAKILMPLFFIRFIVSSLNLTFSLFNQQKIELFMNIFLFSISILTLVISKSHTFEYFLSIYSILMTIVYIIILYSLYKIAKVEK